MTIDKESISKEQTRSLRWNTEDTRPLPKLPGQQDEERDGYIIVRGPDDGPRWLYRLSYKHTLQVGRHFRCDIVIDDAKCSRFHCELIKAAGQWMVSHKSDTNPTRVNEEEVETRFLENGDVIRVGKTRITFHTDQPTTDEVIDCRCDV